jgi:hypothetical protein
MGCLGNETNQALADVAHRSMLLQCERLHIQTRSAGVGTTLTRCRKIVSKVSVENRKNSQGIYGMFGEINKCLQYKVGT